MLENFIKLKYSYTKITNLSAIGKTDFMINVDIKDIVS